MKIIYSRAGQTFHLDAEKSARGIEIQLEGAHVPVHVVVSDAPRVTFVCDGIQHTARVVADGKRRWVHWNGKTFVLERGEAAAGRATRVEHEGAGAGIVTAPMPGQVRGVLAQVGDLVEEGQPLLLLEAMKMEIRVTATRAGQLVEFDVQVGQTVEREQIVARIQDAPDTNE